MTDPYNSSLLYHKLYDCQENVERKKRSQDGTCSLHQISVNLTQIGWDFVISPSLLEYRYCSGVCSLTDIPARMFIKQHGQIRYVSCSDSTLTSPDRETFLSRNWREVERILCPPPVVHPHTTRLSPWSISMVTITMEGPSFEGESSRIPLPPPAAAVEGLVLSCLVCIYLLIIHPDNRHMKSYTILAASNLHIIL